MENNIKKFQPKVEIFLTEMDKQKIFLLRVDVLQENIQTSMKTENVTPQEVIGFLEMAKDQILDNLKQGRKDIFQAFKKDGEQ